MLPIIIIFSHYATGPNWKSLTSPAILPLTTDDFPSERDLKLLYVQSFYTLTLPERGSRDFDSTGNNFNQN